MKNLFFLLILCFHAGILPAQDTIYRMDGAKQVGKIVEINPTQVKYIPVDNSDGPVFTITKQTVAKIVYKDGSVISFKEIRESDAIKLTETSVEPAKSNIIALNIFDPIFKNTLSVSYEYLSKSGSWGYKIPLSIGIKNRKTVDYESYSYKLFTTGFALNFYPFDDIQHRFYAGIAGTVGNKNNYIVFYDFINGVTKHNKENVFFLAFALNTGYQYSLSNHLLLNLQLGMSFETATYTEFTQLRFPLEFSICYTF